MPCFHPLLGYRVLHPNENGKYPLLFTRPKDGMYELQKVSCGQCIGCRLERSRQWAVRCEHEARLYGENNMFLTLTFDGKKVDVETANNLKPKVFVDFMKRLREHISPLKCRFFHCGEYGSERGRPHHHAIIFGYRFPDMYVFFRNNGLPVYRSPTLEKLWKFGFSSIGDVSFESCAYVARYIMKKQTGDRASVYHGKQPEYVTMSRRPGIGVGFLERYEKDIYPQDQVIIRGGIKCRPPRYYDDLYARHHGESALDLIKEERRKKADEQDRLDYRDYFKARGLVVQNALDRASKRFSAHRELEELSKVRLKSKLQQKEEITKEVLKVLPRPLESLQEEVYQDLENEL